VKRAAVLLALAGIAGALWYLQRASTVHTASAADPPLPPAPARRGPITKVTKLHGTAQRKQLADTIAAAHASRTAGPRPAPAPGISGVRAPAPPSLPAEAVAASQAETLRVEIRTAMRDVIPLLRACYEAAIPELAEPETRVVAELTLTGDSDVGTLIDAKQVRADQGGPLPVAFDGCLRSTLRSLALPPLAEGDQFEVHYPFVFAKN
jgi:hypothetical protein